MRRIFTIVPALARAGTPALASIADATSPSGRSRLRPRSADAETPNQVIVWNRILLGIVRTPGERPATIHPTRSAAMMHLAIADAVSAITRRFQPYGLGLTASLYASQSAAAACAAHAVLSALYPTRKANLDADLANSLSTVRNGSGKTTGVAVGVRAGLSILRLRHHDGSAAPAPRFEPSDTAGQYQLTPPEFIAPAFAQWPDVTPFVLQRGNQFRPGPPPPITSEAYVNALAEVRWLGEEHSLTRAPDQTQLGQFWSAPIQNFWNEIAQTASLAHHDSIVDDARLFSLLNVSFADTVIAVYDAKYATRHWRPVSAVNSDGIPSDASWVPLVKTPADPSCPAVHSAISAGAATILCDEFGDRFDFEVSSVVLPGVRRHFSSFSAAALEAGLSRIYAGDHFRFDHGAGERLGRRVARYVVTHTLSLERSGRTRR